MNPQWLKLKKHALILLVRGRRRRGLRRGSEHGASLVRDIPFFTSLESMHQNTRTEGDGRKRKLDDGLTADSAASVKQPRQSP